MNCKPISLFCAFCILLHRRCLDFHSTSHVPWLVFAVYGYEWPFNCKLSGINVRQERLQPGQGTPEKITYYKGTTWVGLNGIYSRFDLAYGQSNLCQKLYSYFAEVTTQFLLMASPGETKPKGVEGTRPALNFWRPSGCDWRATRLAPGPHWGVLSSQRVLKQLGIPGLGLLQKVGS